MQPIVRETESEDRLIIEVEGRLQGGDSTAFQELLLKRAERKPPAMLIDLTHVTRVDSLGLRAFIVTSNKVKSYGGRMVLCCLQRIVEDVFDISGFSSFFEIHPTREGAEQALDQPGMYPTPETEKAR